MGIYDILSSVNGIHSEIRPLDKEKDIEIYQSEENLQKVLDYIKEAGGTGTILVTDAKMFNVYYVEEENGIYFELTIFSVDYLEMSQFKRQLSVLRETQSELKEARNWEIYFYHIANALKMYAFERIYKEIPTDEVSEVFFSLYSGIDYNAACVKPEVFDYICEHTKRKPNDKKVTIYRGEGDKSLPYDEAFSWTTDINTAIWFATKNGRGRAVYKAKVKRSDIIFTSNNRNEHEVVVRPENLLDLEQLDMHSCEDFDEVCELVGPFLPFCKECADIITELYAEDKETGAVHNAEHISRVLLLSLLIADELNLSDEDTDLLAFAAIYHDCGRSHDGVDAEHGLHSAERFIKTLVASNMGKENAAIVYNAIKYHSRDDKDGIKAIQEDKNIQNKKRGLRLYKILKDADALDRFRLGRAGGGGGAFNYKYLRLKESKRFVLVANILLSAKAADVILK